MRFPVFSRVLAPLFLVAAAGVGAPTAQGGGRPDSPSDFLFPGEYESHEAMWLSWPTYENKAGFSALEAQLAMIRGLKDSVQVNLIVNPDEKPDPEMPDADWRWQTAAGAAEILSATGTPSQHVKFFKITHGDIWIRDMGPQFIRNPLGVLRIVDWNFNAWGHEEPTSDYSMMEEAVDRTVAAQLGVETVLPREDNGVRMIHEGGGVTHNGHGTMIAIESVGMQRQLGPNRFCGGAAPVSDPTSPTTYRHHPGWKVCQKKLEAEYARVLGVREVIWLPTGVIEDDGTYRGPLAPHLKVDSLATKRLKPELQGNLPVDASTSLGLTQTDAHLDDEVENIDHRGVYPIFTTNGHADEFVRFVDDSTLMLAETELPPPLPAGASQLEQLEHWLEMENHARLERAYSILSQARTADGKPLRIVRLPTPKFMFDVYREGDGMYDYYAGYDRWEDGTTPETFPKRMFIVLPASYANFFPTNNTVLLPKFYNPLRSDRSSPEIMRKDMEAEAAVRSAFPGRKIVRVWNENVNRGGGGVNCITQQQPAGAAFAQACPFKKVKVDVGTTTLYASSTGLNPVGAVSRLSEGKNVYLRRLTIKDGRTHVTVDRKSGWVDNAAVESAGERCMDLVPR